MSARLPSASPVSRLARASHSITPIETAVSTMPTGLAIGRFGRDQRAHRLERDVGRQDHEGDAHQQLRPALDALDGLLVELAALLRCAGAR